MCATSLPSPTSDSPTIMLIDLCHVCVSVCVAVDWDVALALHVSVGQAPSRPARRRRSRDPYHVASKPPANNVATVRSALVPGLRPRRLERLHPTPQLARASTVRPQGGARAARAAASLDDSLRHRGADLARNVGIRTRGPGSPGTRAGGPAASRPVARAAARRRQPRVEQRPRSRWRTGAAMRSRSAASAIASRRVTRPARARRAVGAAPRPAGLASAMAR